MNDIVIERVKDKRNILLAGDTNAKPSNHSMRKIEKHPTNVFDNDLTSTYNVRRKTNPEHATNAWDQMFVCSNVKVLGKDCSDVDISGNLSPVVELEITNLGKEQ